MNKDIVRFEKRYDEIAGRKYIKEYSAYDVRIVPFYRNDKAVRYDIYKDYSNGETKYVDFGMTLTEAKVYAMNYIM